MTKAGTPKAGQVVQHHFLWSAEQAGGRTEAGKSRPCIIIAVEARPGADFPRVTVLPITSRAPRSGTTAIAVPDSLKAHVGLDSARPAWVVIDEANVFTWPGYDLVPQPK
jgi:mRNA-degrading endonuclease toxin of MazEF toxin-antitoxin module